LEAEQQRVVNSFLQLQNQQDQGLALVASAAAAASATPAKPVVEDSDYSSRFLDDDEVMLGRSHSLASNASAIVKPEVKSSLYRSFSKDLHDHIDRNDDAMKRIDTLTSNLHSAVTGNDNNNVLDEDSVLGFEDEFKVDPDDGDDEEEEEVLTRS
jgi:hypothetical protein